MTDSLKRQIFIFALILILVSVGLMIASVTMRSTTPDVHQQVVQRGVTFHFYEVKPLGDRNETDSGVQPPIRPLANVMPPKVCFNMVVTPKVAAGSTISSIIVRSNLLDPVENRYDLNLKITTKLAEQYGFQPADPKRKTGGKNGGVVMVPVPITLRQLQVINVPPGTHDEILIEISGWPTRGSMPDKAGANPATGSQRNADLKPVKEIIRFPFSVDTPAHIAAGPRRMKRIKAFNYFGIGGILLGLLIAYLMRLYAESHGG